MFTVGVNIFCALDFPPYILGRHLWLPTPFWFTHYPGDSISVRPTSFSFTTPTHSKPNFSSLDTFCTKEVSLSHTTQALVKPG